MDWDDFIPDTPGGTYHPLLILGFVTKADVSATDPESVRLRAVSTELFLALAEKIPDLKVSLLKAVERAFDSLKPPDDRPKDVTYTFITRSPDA